MARFSLILVLTAFTLISCSFLIGQPNKSLVDNPPLPDVVNVDPQNFEPERKPDAPYLQTPSEVVIKMLAMAQVKSTDVVCDLGSGDGRIVIAAAQKFGAKAMGIEIDPELIRESDRELKLAIAQTPEIRDRVEFIKQDFFQADLREVTVITLYLTPQANQRVRSEILPKLRSGTRVVSYKYSFGDSEGDLQPDRVEEVKVNGDQQMIYLWIVNEL